jgi:hypothetical protein
MAQLLENQPSDLPIKPADVTMGRFALVFHPNQISPAIQLGPNSIGKLAHPLPHWQKKSMFGFILRLVCH